MSEVESYEFITQVKLVCGFLLMVLTVFAGALVFALVSGLRRARSIPPAAPIERGSVWRFKGTAGDPWARISHDVVVLDTRAGWVRYSMGGSFTDCRSTEGAFRYCYEPVPCETRQFAA